MRRDEGLGDIVRGTFGRKAGLVVIGALLMASAACSGSNEDTTPAGEFKPSPAAATGPTPTTAAAMSAATTAADASLPAKAAGPAVPSGGCAQGAKGTGQGEELTVESGGVTRAYRQFVPTAADASADATPRPLVLNIHGLGMNRDQQTSFSAWEK